MMQPNSVFLCKKNKLYCIRRRGFLTFSEASSPYPQPSSNVKSISGHLVQKHILVTATINYSAQSRAHKSKASVHFWKGHSRQSWLLQCSQFSTTKAQSPLLLTGIRYRETVGCFNVVHVRNQIERRFSRVGVSVVEINCKPKSTVFLIRISHEQPSCKTKKTMVVSSAKSNPLASFYGTNTDSMC